MFPEQVHYSRTSCPGWKIKDWDTANKLLSYLEPNKWHFAIFELADNSYIQCLGSKTALTVEAREYDKSGNYKHWVFGKGEITNETTKVGGEAGQVEVDKSQVLTMRDARQIIRQFLESRSFPERYQKQDVTYRF